MIRSRSRPTQAECQRARHLERNRGPISHNCTYLLDIYHASWRESPADSDCLHSGMRDLLSTVSARLGSLLKKGVMNFSPTSILPAKRPRDHSPIPCAAPANSKRFRNAIVLAPMVRSGNCKLLSTSPEYLRFQNSKLLLGLAPSFLQANSFGTSTY